jgi:hypothetical protein
MESPPEPRGLRYELKLECEPGSYAQVAAWVRLHSAGFREAYAPRQVNSLYLDTLSFDTLNDHIEGVPERRKLRFRWYGPDLGTARGQMELKSKRERAGWKVTCPVQGAIELRCGDWSTIRRDLLTGLSDGAAGADQALFRELIQVARPLVINSYQRRYYVSADGRVRLTVDDRLRAYDQWRTARPNISFRTPLPDLFVVELKSDVRHAAYLADVLAEFPLRVHRHSKYVSALSSLLER